VWTGAQFPTSVFRAKQSRKCVHIKLSWQVKGNGKAVPGEALKAPGS